MLKFVLEHFIITFLSWFTSASHNMRSLKWFETGSAVIFVIYFFCSLVACGTEAILFRKHRQKIALAWDEKKKKISVIWVWIEIFAMKSNYRAIVEIPYCRFAIYHSQWSSKARIRSRQFWITMRKEKTGQTQSSLLELPWKFIKLRQALSIEDLEGREIQMKERTKKKEYI